MPGTSNQPGPPPKPQGSQRFFSETLWTPGQVIEAPQVPVWDVRPLDERNAEPGFIPGSRSVPLTRDNILELPWQDIAQETGGIVLCCLSGRRSGALVTELQLAGYSGIVSLDGGVLGWLESGQALCTPAPEEPEEHFHITRVEQLSRAVMSCFIAEASRSQADEEASDHAGELVSRIFGRPGSVSSYERTLDTLDLLGENARRWGHPIERIAQNLNAMRATANRLTWE